MADVKSQNNEKLTFLRNKPPRWNEATQSHCLNFGGRVTLPSIKNFQLIAEKDGKEKVGRIDRVKDSVSNKFLYPHPFTHSPTCSYIEATVVMQFGRCGPEYFTLDARGPMTPLTAFAIALTSFDAYDNA